MGRAGAGIIVLIYCRVRGFRFINNKYLDLMINALWQPHTAFRIYS